jgi:hypothetical protein
MGDDGKARRLGQCPALLRWAMRHPARNPEANAPNLRSGSQDRSGVFADELEPAPDGRA